MSSQDEASSVVSSSHDRSDDDWDGSDADAGAAAKKKKKVVVAPATSGRRQLARRPVKPRTTNTFGNYSSSDSSSSSDSDDDVKNSNTNTAQSNGKDDDSSAAASSDSPPQKRQQPKKKIQRKKSTQPPKQKASAIAKESNIKSKSSVAKKSRKKVESESESEEEEEWNDDEEQEQSESSESKSDDSDSDFGAPPSSNKRRGGNKTKKSPAAARKKSSTSTSTRTPRSKRTTRQKMNISYGSEQSSDNEEIQYHTTPTGTRRPSRSCSQRTNKRMSQVVKQDMKSERDALGEVLEDDDKELLENSSSEKSDDDNDDNDDDEKGDADDKRLQKRLRNNRVSNGRAKAVKKRGTNKYDDDDDYDENANSSNDDDDSDDDNDDDDDDDFEIDSDDMAVSKRRSNRTQQNRGRGGKKKPNYTEIDSDIGTADENTTDEETGPSLLTSPVNAKKKSSGSYGSPAMRKRARAGRGGRTPLDMREDDGSSSNNEDEDDEQQPSSKKRKQQTPASTRKRRPYMDSSDSDSDEQDTIPSQHSELRTTHNCCPSLIDDITMMNLPKNKPHVCYIAPDGKSRHCFTLDTLYRIAISAKGDRDSTTSNEKLTFLQPPHFRSEMEDDLIDQIASRFGRSALEIENSAVYKKIKGGRLGSSSINLDELDEFDEDGNFVGDGEGDGVNFQDRFQRFIATLMGSSDVYCCPLCYIEADRRLGNQDDDERVEDDESGDEQRGNESHVDRFSFLDDPLTILGNLDGEAFEVAATFCFRLLSGLKKHLKVVHGVNLSDIAGNDLFKRFQIRAGDGLLQRWLQKNLRRNTVQGDMMRYWNSGENQSFLLLLSQIDRCDQDYSSDFSLSFPNRARKVWSQVSAPYLKQSEDLDDFIADDDEEIEEGDDDGGVPINPHFTPPSINSKDPSDFKSPEEEMIANLQKKNRRYKSTYDDSDDASGSGGRKSSSSSDEDELEILDPKPTVEESEDDEWTKSKSYNSKVKHKSAKAVGANNDSEDDVFDDDVEIIEEKPSASKTPTSARKRIMESSSDEESY